jgi:hypothetical protein
MWETGGGNDEYEYFSGLVASGMREGRDEGASPSWSAAIFRRPRPAAVAPRDALRAIVCVDRVTCSSTSCDPVRNRNNNFEAGPTEVA